MSGIQIQQAAEIGRFGRVDIWRCHGRRLPTGDVGLPSLGAEGGLDGHALTDHPAPFCGCLGLFMADVLHFVREDGG